MRIVIIGNSGSGKSTLAQALAGRAAGESAVAAVPVLDLDTVAWEPVAVGMERSAPVRRGREEVRRRLEAFCTAPEWIIEGCYGEIAEMVLSLRPAPELVFLNPDVEACARNCRERSWEPHKYESKAAQDASLEMLLGWVRAYPQRGDDCSLAYHRRIFDAYTGPKREVSGPDELLRGG